VGECRGRKAVQIVAAFEHRNQAASGVSIGDFQHQRRQVGEVVV